MQKHTISRGNHVSHALHQAAHVGADALSTAREGAARAATNTEKLVRRYPLAAVGFALGGGIAIGVFAHWLFRPGQPRA